jgi:outer membrane protein assembly factor BamE (lipoprotein component of BamABCDE complex)
MRQMMGMTKHEFRMTKTNMKLERILQDRHLHSFGIRHWSFVIPAISRCALVLVLVVLIAGCVGRRLTKANVDEVAEGMSKKQVESILGPPTELDNKDFLILKKTTYVYRQGKDTVTIVFKDDKVAEKQSTLTD